MVVRAVARPRAQPLLQPESGQPGIYCACLPLSITLGTHRLKFNGSLLTGALYHVATVISVPSFRSD